MCHWTWITHYFWLINILPITNCVSISIEDMLLINCFCEHYYYFRFRFSFYVRLFDIIMRKLKYHEKKLLKKVDFLSWEIDNNLHEVRVMKKYYVQKREDYTKWGLVNDAFVLSRELMMTRSKVTRVHDFTRSVLLPKAWCMIDLHKNTLLAPVKLRQPTAVSREHGEHEFTRQNERNITFNYNG